MKHTLLVQLLRALQQKEKGLLYIDTHAGRGTYDLTLSNQGATHSRKPEHPDGAGRLWAREDAPALVADYLSLLRKFDREWGNLTATPRYFPGSPWLARSLARPQDRLALCEKQPEECEALRAEFGGARRVTVHEMDGYGAFKAMLPPPERRALTLIDPPFEAQDEFAQITAALRVGLQRMPAGVFAIWYPLTGRARADAFFAELCLLRPPPTLVLELTVAGDCSTLKMKGCGLVVINPPWRFDLEGGLALEWLASALAQEPGGGSRQHWLVPE